MYGPVHPNRYMADKALIAAEFSTMRFHKVERVNAIWVGDRLVRPAGFIVVDINDQVSLMEDDLCAA